MDSQVHPSRHEMERGVCQNVGETDEPSASQVWSMTPIFMDIQKIQSQHLVERTADLLTIFLYQFHGHVRNRLQCRSHCSAEDEVTSLDSETGKSTCGNWDNVVDVSERPDS